MLLDIDLDLDLDLHQDLDQDLDLDLGADLELDNNFTKTAQAPGNLKLNGFNGRYVT